MHVPLRWEEASNLSFDVSKNQEHCDSIERHDEDNDRRVPTSSPRPYRRCPVDDNNAEHSVHPTLDSKESIPASRTIEPKPTFGGQLNITDRASRRIGINNRHENSCNLQQPDPAAIVHPLLACRRDAGHALIGVTSLCHSLTPVGRGFECNGLVTTVNEALDLRCHSALSARISFRHSFPISSSVDELSAGGTDCQTFRSSNAVARAG